MSNPVFLMAGLNALINLVSLFVIIRARKRIAQRDVDGHRRLMLAATVLQAVFLTIYLSKAALFGTTPFEGDPTVRLIYLVILGVHTVAATVSAPLVVVTLILGLTRRLAMHKRWARWAYPTWVFVSATGPLTFLMLYGFGQPGYGVQALAAAAQLLLAPR